MTGEQVHRAISADGTQIVGRMLGRGPALVLVHGGIGDGEVAWESMLSHLADRFTCYLPSTRGRGLSSDNPDHSAQRLEEDVTAFVDSIGEPAYLFGWSGGGPWALGAAARTSSVAAIAVYEPAVPSVMQGRDLADTLAAMQQVGMAASNGQSLEAIRAFAEWICTEPEIAALEQLDFYERWADRIPAMLRFLQADAADRGPRSTDPEMLRTINVPLLLLRGGQTHLGTWFADAERHVAQHVADVRVRELPGIGHFAPLVAPERIATELKSYFATVGLESIQQSA